MEIKLILSDLDETLLHSDKSISDYSVRIFEQCRQRGILVGFCTSRGKSNIIPFEKKINPDICICNGGASIYHNRTLLHASYFSIEEINSILKGIPLCKINWRKNILIVPEREMPKPSSTWEDCFFNCSSILIFVATVSMLTI